MKSRRGFSQAYRTGERRRHGAIAAVVAPGPPGLPLVGFVAGKRVGTAVLRNRAKRRMRAATSRCSLKSDTVYVLIADRGVVSADFERLVGWIKRCTADKSVGEET